jgi:cation diffusion facilitator CzcD-associated flavoprotein CzcO
MNSGLEPHRPHQGRAAATFPLLCPAMATSGSARRKGPERAPHPSTPRPLPSHVRIAIVGAGFSGLGAAIALADQGYGDELILLERRSDVGGTWYDNSYPGCRCDVPSNLYSFSFAPNPNWSETFSSQPEIEHYLQTTARRYGVTDKVAFDTTLEAASWDATRRVWDITTTRGSLTADFLISGGGALSEPHIPDLPGLATFAGTTFHSAQWKHAHDLTGRRVAIIGTGASTIQFLPIVQKSAGRVILFQRTPPWVLPHPNRRTRAVERAAYGRLPWTQRVSRARNYWFREALLGSLLIHNSVKLRKLEGLAKKFMARQVADPELRAKLTPTYTAGCKRLLQSNDYYPALQRPNVSLETEKIIEVQPDGLVTADGVVHRADTIIYGTGFRVANNPMGEKVRGIDGRTLTEHWATTGMQAYCGTTIAGFPNYFMLAGPNTGIGHTSLVVMIEAQVAHIVGALRALQARGASVIEVRPDVQARWNEEVQRKAAPTVWNSGGCSSWYLDDAGRNTTLWPDYTFRFVRRTRLFGAGDYLMTGPLMTGPLMTGPLMTPRLTS